MYNVFAMKISHLYSRCVLLYRYAISCFWKRLSEIRPHLFTAALKIRRQVNSTSFGVHSRHSTCTRLQLCKDGHLFQTMTVGVDHQVARVSPGSVK